MGAKGVVSLIAIVVLLFPLAAASVSESSRDAQQLPPDNLSNLEEMVDEETTKLVWANCGAEFTHLMETFQDLQSSSIDKTFILQYPVVKKNMLDCFRDKNIHFPVSVKDKHVKRLYIEHLESFVVRPTDAPIRRRLAEANAPAPSTSRSPSPSSLPSSATNCEAQNDEKTPCSPLLPKKHAHSTLEKDIEPIPFTVSKAGSGGGITPTTIIIAVVATATVTFLLATLLFCWYTRTYGAQNDEKPLLSLSMDRSNGGSKKSSYNKQNSANDFGNAGDQSLDVNSKLQKNESSVSSVSLGIPPPPGSLSSGIPPLKPLQQPPVTPPSPPTTTAALATPPGSPPVPPTSVRPTATPPPRTPPRGAPPPPPKPAGKEGLRPPPPPGGIAPPPRPPSGGLRPSRPSSGADQSDANKTKLKPFFWDKVMANPDQAMVWHQIKAGSFQFNEEMIENLFGYNATEKAKVQNKKTSSQDSTHQFVQILDPKKAQNLSILLKALSVTTEEVCDALKEGNELPIELVQTLLKMAPTGEEELKLRMYTGELSRLGNAERFLKVLVEIPFAFKRLESLLFMCTLQEEGASIKESFKTLEAACIELRKSRLFLKLLEAVLKTGNRMNDGTFRGSAQAFKLDTLLKLSDVKGVDGKTTLLHFVVLEIIRAEGVRAAKTARENKSISSFKSDDLLEEASSSTQDSDEYYRMLGLQVVSSLSSELENVKKAAILDADGLTNLVSKLGHALIKAREFLNTDMKNVDEDDEDEFREILTNFVQDAEKEIMWMLEEEKRIMMLVKNTADYFHGQAGKDEGLRLFIIVRDFLIILDKVCKEVKNAPLKPPKKDVSSSKTETKDGSLSNKTKDAIDASSPTTTRTNDVSSDTTAQTKDVSSPRTQETDNTGRKTHETNGLGPKTQETNGLGPKTQETDTSGPKTQETDDLGPQTQRTDDLGPKPQETDDLGPKMQETDGMGPKTHKTDDLGPETQDTDSSGSETDETEDLQHETQEIDDLLHEIQETNDLLFQTQETEYLENEMPETDDLQNESQEGDNWRRETQEDDLQPDTHEGDDDSQHETGEDDDSQPGTREKDTQPTSGRSSEPHQSPFGVPHELLHPAIAMRRVDTLSSDSSSDED